MSEDLATDTTDTTDAYDTYDTDAGEGLDYDEDLEEDEDDDELGSNAGPDDHDDLDEDDDFDEDDEEDEDDDEDHERELDEADEIVLGLLERVERAEELDRGEIHDLGLLLGDKRAGTALGRQLNKEAKQAQARRPKRRRGFWHWFAGPIHEQGDPIPDSVAAVLLRIQEGRPLDWQDFKRLGAVVGRRSVRLLESLIHGAVVRDSRRRGRGRGGRR